MISLKFPKWEPFEPFFNPIFEFIKDETDPQTAKIKLEAFLVSEPIRSRTDDDVTLLLAVRKETSVSVENKPKIKSVKKNEKSSIDNNHLKGQLFKQFLKKRFVK